MEDPEASNGDGNVALDAPAGDAPESVASPGEEVGAEPMIGSAGGEITDSPELAATAERAASPVLLDAFHASYSDRAARIAMRRGEHAPRTVFGPDKRV